MRSQLAVKEQSVIDRLLFYNADRVGGGGQPVMLNNYKELTNLGIALGEQNIKPGSQIIVTTIAKVSAFMRRLPRRLATAGSFVLWLSVCVTCVVSARRDT